MDTQSITLRSVTDLEDTPDCLTGPEREARPDLLVALPPELLTRP